MESFWKIHVKTSFININESSKNQREVNRLEKLHMNITEPYVNNSHVKINESLGGKSRKKN